MKKLLLILLSFFVVGNVHTMQRKEKLYDHEGWGKYILRVGTGSLAVGLGTYYTIRKIISGEVDRTLGCTAAVAGAGLLFFRSPYSMSKQEKETGIAVRKFIKNRKRNLHDFNEFLISNQPDDTLPTVAIMAGLINDGDKEMRKITDEKYVKYIMRQASLGYKIYFWLKYAFNLESVDYDEIDRDLKNYIKPHTKEYEREEASVLMPSLLLYTLPWGKTVNNSILPNLFLLQKLSNVPAGTKNPHIIYVQEENKKKYALLRNAQNSMHEKILWKLAALYGYDIRVCKPVTYLFNGPDGKAIDKRMKQEADNLELKLNSFYSGYRGDETQIDHNFLTVLIRHKIITFQWRNHHKDDLFLPMLRRFLCDDNYRERCKTLIEAEDKCTTWDRVSEDDQLKWINLFKEVRNQDLKNEEQGSSQNPEGKGKEKEQ